MHNRGYRNNPNECPICGGEPLCRNDHRVEYKGFIIVEGKSNYSIDLPDHTKVHFKTVSEAQSFVDYWYAHQSEWI